MKMFFSAAAIATACARGSGATEKECDAIICARISPAGCNGGKFVRAGQRFAETPDPMLLKRALQFRHERAFDAGVNFAPMILRIRIPLPLFRETDTAGESQFAIDHQDATMSAAIGSIHPPGASRVVICHLTSCVTHHPDIVIVELRPCANPIKQHPHAHAASRLFAKGIAKLPPYGVRIEKKCLKVDAFLRAVDRREQSGKNLNPIVQQLDLVSTDGKRISQGMRRSKELRIPTPKVCSGRNAITSRRTKRMATIAAEISSAPSTANQPPNGSRHHFSPFDREDRAIRRSRAGGSADPESQMDIAPRTDRSRPLLTRSSVFRFRTFSNEA